MRERYEAWSEREDKNDFLFTFPDIRVIWFQIKRLNGTNRQKNTGLYRLKRFRGTE